MDHADLGGLFDFQKARRMRSSEETLQPDVLQLWRGWLIA
jgi:hypothetical protein